MKMNVIQFFIISVLAIDTHMKQILHISNLSVPRIIDSTQKAKLFCSYEMGTIILNSVKWYKNGLEFFRYSPLTPPTTNWFPVAGVTIADGSSHCNQFICNLELEKLNANSSGSYRCEVSGDAPEFILIDKTAEMTVGVLPKFEPYITGILHSYKYGDYIVANCTSEWSSPPVTLTWLINNKTASSANLQPQINENTKNIDGFLLTTSTLQLRIHVDNQRFIERSEMLELKCTADLMGMPNMRRESLVRATILALKGDGSKQRLLGTDIAHNSQSIASGFQIFSLFCLVILMSKQQQFWNMWNSLNNTS